MLFVATDCQSTVCIMCYCCTTEPAFTHSIYLSSSLLQTLLLL
jgi:hypothetical protein